MEQVVRTVCEPCPSDPPLVHERDARRIEDRTSEGEEETLREDEHLCLYAMGVSQLHEPRIG